MEKKHTQFYWIYVIVTLLLVVGSVVFIIMGLTVETGKDGGEGDSGTVGKGPGCRFGADHAAVYASCRRTICFAGGGRDET